MTFPMRTYTDSISNVLVPYSYCVVNVIVLWKPYQSYAYNVLPLKLMLRLISDIMFGDIVLCVYDPLYDFIHVIISDNINIIHFILLILHMLINM